MRRMAGLCMHTFFSRGPQMPRSWDLAGLMVHRNEHVIRGWGGQLPAMAANLAPSLPRVLHACQAGRWVQGGPLWRVRARLGGLSRGPEGRTPGLPGMAVVILPEGRAWWLFHATSVPYHVILLLCPLLEICLGDRQGRLRATPRAVGGYSQHHVGTRGNFMDAPSTYSCRKVWFSSIVAVTDAH